MEKPLVSAAAINTMLRLAGLICLAIAHAPVLSPAWSQVLGEAAAGMILWAQSRVGDVPVASLPKEWVQLPEPRAPAA